MLLMTLDLQCDEGKHLKQTLNFNVNLNHSVMQAHLFVRCLASYLIL
jgi:hypothetical protein